MKNFRIPILAVLLSIVVTTTMDFSGYTLFSALPLLAIIVLFWLVERHSSGALGLRWGQPKYYGIAVLYPIVVVSVTVMLAAALGELHFTADEPAKLIRDILLNASVGMLAILLTEEGFFRGWLWASFGKAGLSARRTLLVTSLCFMLWHVSAVAAPTEYGLPWHQIPIYLINVVLLGLNWGLLRHLSGSVVVPSVCHALWNGLVYGLFGYGEKYGALGIENSIVYGPELGVLGIILNGMVFIWMWRRSQL